VFSLVRLRVMDLLDHPTICEAFHHRFRCLGVEAPEQFQILSQNAASVNLADTIL
jgi:hypothetical protein